MSETNPRLEALCDFLRDSPTPFHAVQNLLASLRSAGYDVLDEGDAWQLEPGKRYVVMRNASSFVAFLLGTEAVFDSGIHIVGAHTDSPCLKVKPTPEMVRQGCLQLGVEVYGGVLLAPWFDRDLSLAGRVTYLDQQRRLASALIDFKRPVAVIPSLAIHLDREVNSNRSINAQLHLPPVMTLAGEGCKVDFRDLLKQQLRERQDVVAQEILAYEISLYDTQPPAVVGLAGEFIAGARLDNLLSCFVATQALLHASGQRTAMVVCSDHEEVGSASVAGAQGTLLQSVLRRLADSHESFRRMINRSLLISCDNAHGIHPNFADKHDANHGPILNQGPVIKINANQRYATSSETAGFFRNLSAQVQVPVQSFVVRSDMACGSTIGPIVATEVGVRTVDVGVPQWAMHSIRETAGTLDFEYLFRVLQQFFRV